MANFNIERLEGRGITAEVIDSGEVYRSYISFAKAAGYPDAGNHSNHIGKRVTILAKGLHGSTRGVLYVVDDGNSKYVIGAPGLRIDRNDQLRTQLNELKTQVDALNN